MPNSQKHISAYNGPFIARLARNEKEIRKAQKLRFEVFNLELNEGLAKSWKTGWDEDAYDGWCEHLIVIDTSENDRVVGNYRLLREENARQGIGFYSEIEFNCSNFYDLPGNVTEMGRTCVHKDYRDKGVIVLLWSALARYYEWFKIKYMVGCSSFHTNEKHEINEAVAYLKKKHWAHESAQVKPTKKYIYKNYVKNWVLQDSKMAFQKLPTILKGYLRLGARICSVPAWDDEFSTIDILIFLETSRFTERYKKRFQINKIEDIQLKITAA